MALGGGLDRAGRGLSGPLAEDEQMRTSTASFPLSSPTGDEKPRGGRVPAQPQAITLRALGLGDLLTAVPALRALGRAFPDHDHLLAAPSGLAPLIDLIGVAHRIVASDGLQSLASDDRPVLAVNIHGRGPQSHRLLQALRPDRLIAFANIAADHDGPAWRADEHEVHRWCRLLTESGVPADPDDLDLRRPSAPAPAVARGAVVIHPGAASEARRWPAMRWAEVARRLAADGASVVVTGSRDELNLAEAIARMAGLDRAAVLAGRTNVVELAAVISACRCVLSGDTGVAHLGHGVRHTVRGAVRSGFAGDVGTADRTLLAPGALVRLGGEPARPPAGSRAATHQRRRRSRGSSPASVPHVGMSAQAEPTTSGAGGQVTILMLTWNRRADVLANVPRLLALPEQPPVIVVDNGSADGTAEAIRKRHPSVSVVALNENCGAAGRNVGAELAVTPYIAFSDDDSWWRPGALRHAAELLEAYPGVALLAATVVLGDRGPADPDHRPHAQESVASGSGAARSRSPRLHRVRCSGPPIGVPGGRRVQSAARDRRRGMAARHAPARRPLPPAFAISSDRRGRASSGGAGGRRRKARRARGRRR